jgi:hypothetical protein
MSAGVQTYRILVGRPMVRGMVVTIRYADGYVERHASTRVGAMELGRAAVRNAMVCRCSEYGPIFMRSLADPTRLVPVHGGNPSPKTIEARLR